jgi:hypothetical protein
MKASNLKDSITKDVEKAESFRENFSSLFSGKVTWWQIDCGKGWNNLICSFLEEFKHHINKKKKKTKIVEIKQHYGDLKIVLTEKDDEADDLIDKYTKLCGKYCEICLKHNPFKEDF